MRRDVEAHEMQPGDYGRDPRNSEWYCCVPNGLRGCLRAHEVTEHEDGTITVSPSILVQGSPSWHGYLEKGIWREV